MATHYIEEFPTTADFLARSADRSNKLGVGSVSEVLYINKAGAAVEVPTKGLVTVAATPLTVTKAAHAERTIALNLAGGIAATLPAATGSGDRYRFVVQATLTGDTTIKVANANDYMIGTAVLFQDGGDTVVGFATANTGTVATETDTIDLFDASNVTGGFKGAHVEVQDIAANVWWVHYVSDAAGTEATPFKVTV